MYQINNISKQEVIVHTGTSSIKLKPNCQLTTPHVVNVQVLLSTCVVIYNGSKLETYTTVESREALVADNTVEDQPKKSVKKTRKKK